VERPARGNSFSGELRGILTGEAPRGFGRGHWGKIKTAVKGQHSKKNWGGNGNLRLYQSKRGFQRKAGERWRSRTNS